MSQNISRNYIYWPLPDYAARGPVPAIVIPDPNTAIGMGYGESKWVASRILEISREETPLKPTIVRIGQLCGNYETGSWNPWEWFPSIVRSAKAVRSLPKLKGVSRYLFERTNPIDTSLLGAILDSCWHCCLYDCGSAESWRSCVSSKSRASIPRRFEDNYGSNCPVSGPSRSVIFCLAWRSETRQGDNARW